MSWNITIVSRYVICTCPFPSLKACLSVYSLVFCICRWSLGGSLRSRLLYVSADLSRISRGTCVVHATCLPASWMFHVYYRLAPLSSVDDRCLALLPVDRYLQFHAPFRDGLSSCLQSVHDQSWISNAVYRLHTGPVLCFVSERLLCSFDFSIVVMGLALTLTRRFLRYKASILRMLYYSFMNPRRDRLSFDFCRFLCLRIH